VCNEIGFMMRRDHLSYEEVIYRLIAEDMGFDLEEDSEEIWAAVYTYMDACDGQPAGAYNDALADVF